MGKIEHQDLGSWQQALAGGGDLGQQALGIANVDGNSIGAGQIHGVRVNGERGRGNQGGITGAKQGQAHVAEPLFGADGGDHLGLGIKGYAVSILVLLGNLFAEVENARGHAVAVILVFAGCLAQLIDHVIGRGIGWVTHAEVDDVGTVLPHLVLQLIDAPEKIGRQVFHPRGDLDGEPLARIGSGAVVGVAVEGWVAHSREILRYNQ